MKEWAIDQGYIVTKKKVARISWHKTETGVAGYRKDKASNLTKRRDDLIDNGTIEMGRKIVPSTSSSTQIVKGKLVQKTQTYHSQLIPLQSIRMMHLELMDKLELLRHTETDRLSRAAVIELLNDRGSKSVSNI